MGKTSERISKIPSVTSAFNRVIPSMSEGHEASPVLKEKRIPGSDSKGSEVPKPKER